MKKLRLLNSFFPQAKLAWKLTVLHPPVAYVDVLAAGHAHGELFTLETGDRYRHVRDTTVRRCAVRAMVK